MQYIQIVLRNVIVISIFSSIAYGISSSKNPDPTIQTIEVIQKCMESEPVPWPDEWKKEYIETIRKAVELHHNDAHYIERLEILRNGFVPYWDGFKKTDERSLFEVHLAQIRWYVENLMGTEFQTDEERQKLRNQYKELWNYAASSLLKQFPFLDPNAVQEAKSNELSQCYRKIDAPLMPVYLRPMSEEQVEQIKQRWGKLRYIRVDLLHRLDSGSIISSDKSIASSNIERDYELTKESLSQLLGLVWKSIPQQPDYYLEAINNRIDSLKFHIQLKYQAQSDQQYLEKTRSRQLLQTEHISFLLRALLETPLRLENTQSTITREQDPLERQDKTEKGVGAYELNEYL
jgi:hypothetical protein